MENIQQENMNDQDGINTSIHKSKYHCTHNCCGIQINVKGVNIVILYYTLSYMFNLIHVDYDSLELFIPFKKE